MKLPWTDDTAVESKLQRLSVSWTIARDPLKEFDLKGSRENNARGTGTKFNKELAYEYAIAAESGDVFPRVMARPPDPGFKGNFIMGGNHRLGMVEILIDEGFLDVNGDHIEYYKLDCPDAMKRELITRSANRWTGVRQGRDEAVYHAMWMRKQYNTDIKLLAEHLNLKESWLSGQVMLAEFCDELEVKHLVNANEFTHGALRYLRTLRFNESLLRKAGHLVAKFHPKDSVVADIVKSTKAAATKGEQHGAVTLKEWESRLRESSPNLAAGQRHIRRTELTRFKRILSEFRRFCLFGNKGEAFTSVEQMQLTNKHERHELRDHWREIKRTVDDCFRAIEVNTPPKKHAHTTTTTRRRKQSQTRKG